MQVNLMFRWEGADQYRYVDFTHDTEFALCQLTRSEQSSVLTLTFDLHQYCQH